MKKFAKENESTHNKNTCEVIQLKKVSVQSLFMINSNIWYPFSVIN